jgi:aerobic-type carbon monoxide dehydrogenase small subunit (CoxS/CutS family)
MEAKYSVQVNGRTYSVEAEPDTPLLTILREQLDLTGTKYGCGEGQCGACTVLIDGRAHRSCITSVSTITPGKAILTIEGLAVGERLHPVQQAFLDEGAMQCAYCTSGMILSAVSLLNRSPHPSEAEIIQGMQGNICRCGTYPRIVSAIRRAAEAGKQARP